MKGFKKFAFLICALMFVLPVFLTACGGTTEGGSATGSSDIDVSEPKFGFLADDEYDEDTFSIETAKPRNSLDVDTHYYLYLTFDVTSRRDNDGQSLLKVDITFTAMNILKGTIDEAGSGMFEEMTFTDAGTGEVGKTTSVSFKIPPLSSQPKTINMIVSLTPVNVGESHIKINFNYDAPNMKIQGTSGHTKKLTINAVKINAPVLERTTDGVLKWNHVKNADYYCIYDVLNQDPMKDNDGNVIYVRNQGESEGAEMFFNVGEFLFGFHTVRIRAYSNSSNIIQSDFSNTIEYTW